MIIDGRGFINLATTYMVEKFKLPILKHPQAYKLQRSQSSGGIEVNKQVPF